MFARAEGRHAGLPLRPTELDLTFPIEDLDRIAADFPGRLGFYVEDITTGTAYGRNADQRFPTASVIKIAVMVELFRQVHEGRLSLDTRRRLPDGISTHGSGFLQLTKDGPELTLRDYCRLMISVSDNMATDFLMQTVGLDNVNSTMDALGFPNTRASMTLGKWHYTMRGMGELEPSAENDKLFTQKIASDGSAEEGLPWQDSLENNVTTPREMGTIVKRLHEGEIVSPDMSSAMIEILKSCRDRRMSPRHLAADIAVAHKTGGSGRIKGDSGIAYLPSGPLVISVYALADTRDQGGLAADAIGDIARLAVKAVSPESLATE